jgi:hypothetical protein
VKSKAQSVGSLRYRTISGCHGSEIQTEGREKGTEEEIEGKREETNEKNHRVLSTPNGRHGSEVDTEGQKE